MSLSDKIMFNAMSMLQSNPAKEIIHAEDVKDFIKAIKENHTVGGTGQVIIMSREDLDELAGSKLT